MVIAETEREARIGAEGNIGTRIRQRGSGVESLCDVQRVRNDVGTRDARVAMLGLQSARPQTSPGGAKPNAPLNREELELDGQKANHTVSARLAHVAPDRPDIALACEECSRADLTRLKRVERDLLHAPRVVRRFPF